MEYKTIHFYIFKPHSALFKSVRNDKAEVNTVSCCNSDNCGLFKRGECSILAMFSFQQCPYGKYQKYTGFTRKASKYSEWIRGQEEEYTGIGCLKHHSGVMAIVGDYVFLPYPHMTMCESVPFLSKEKIFASGNCFLLSKDFTVDNIIELLHFKPHAFMGDEIKSYQKEVPPKFLKHLSEQIPTMFAEVIKVDEYAKQRYQEFTNIGRKAILETLTPNCGEFKDIHSGLWKWDGVDLISTNSHASFMLVSKFSRLIITPEPKQMVTITDESQVNDNTVFVG